MIILRIRRRRRRKIIVIRRRKIITTKGQSRPTHGSEGPEEGNSCISPKPHPTGTST
jgi:hypothetical protein